MYARIKDSAVVGVHKKLPKSFKTDGGSISNFHTLDDATVATYGFVPLIIDKPDHDPATQRLVGPIRTVEADRVVDVWTVEDIPLADLRAAKKGEINALRDRLLYPGRVDATLTDGTTIIPADLRNETDGRNLQTVMAEALALQADGVTAAVMPFRDADDAAHTLTPVDQIAVCRAASAHGTAIYEASWAHKATIDTLNDAATVAAYDYRADHADAPWPVAAPQDGAA